ncbi:MAG: LysR family transcriptional regulator [Robiginitomaculum sp.]|nr:LysR family transcriptional regulator [Robiginitomaculum sp.]
MNLLRVLDALLRERSTVRAGRRIGLSQPAVSAALARLRLSLGDELFFRSGKTFEPTQFALSLEVPLRNLLAQLEELISGSDAFDPAVSEARFRISGADFFAELLMPVLMERLQGMAPSMRTHLVNMVPSKPFEALTLYDVDLVLIPDMDLPDWAEHQRVLKSDFCVIARSGHQRLASAGVRPGDVIPINLFCDISHVLFSADGKRQAQGDEALARIGRERRVVMTLPVFSGVYRVVAGSELIALLPSALARHVAPSVGLDIFLPPVNVPSVQIVMAWHRRMNADPAHKWLRQQIAELLDDLENAPELRL